MRAKIKQLHAEMQREPHIQDALVGLRTSIRRTFVWMGIREILVVLSGVPLMFFFQEAVKGTEGKLINYAYIGLAFSALKALTVVSESFVGVEQNDVDHRFWRVMWSYGHLKILRQSMKWHVANGTGERESIVGKNISRFSELFVELLFRTTPATLRIIITTIVMYFVHWMFGLYMTVVIIACVIVNIRNNKLFEPLREEYHKRMKEVERYGSELNSLAVLIRTVGMEEVYSLRNDQLLGKFAVDETPRHRKFERGIRVQNMTVSAFQAAFIVLIGYMIVVMQDPSITPGVLAMVVEWKGKAESQFGDYNRLLHLLGKGKESLRELVDFVLLKPDVTNAMIPTTIEHPEGKVVFKDITFTHAGAGEPVICGFNLEIQPNTAVAFVGPSGCGKSTILSLATRNYDPDGGQVLIDNIDVRDLDSIWYRNQLVAVVSQKVELLDGTVADNIRMARPEASDADVIAAATAAGAHDFITRMSDGYNSRIGENGVMLSGGQRQRIAIARALVMKPRILILDEATSSLDAMSQAEVQRTINQLMADRVCTILIVAHRLSTIRSADKIVMMDEGKVIDSGTHTELMNRSEKYREMYSEEQE